MEQQAARRQGRLHHRHPGQFIARRVAQGHVDQPHLRVQIGAHGDGDFAKPQGAAPQCHCGLRLDPVLDPTGGGDFLPQHQQRTDQHRKDRRHDQQQA